MNRPSTPPRWKFEDAAIAPSNRLSTAWQALSQIELRNLAGMLVRQWRLILSIMALFVLLAIAVLSLLNYRYTAEALLAVDERGSELVGQADPIGAGVTFNNRVDSEVEILNSSSVTLGVIDHLALWRDDEFGFNKLSLTDKLKSLIGISPQENKSSTYIRLNDIPGDQQARLVTRLQTALSVERRGLTSVIAIKATSQDKNKAAFIANSVAESYLNVQIAAKDKTAQSAAAFLGQRVDELAKDIQDLNKRTENFIIDQSALVGTQEAKTEMLRIREQMGQIASSQADFSTRLTKLQALQQDPAFGNTTNLPDELRALAEERALAAKKALAQSNDADLQAELRALDQKLKDAAQAQATNVRNQIASSDKRKDDLRQQLQDIFTHQQIPDQVSVDLFRLQNETQNSRKLYESVSNRLAEVRQQLGLTLPNSRIVAPALAPYAPSYPPSIQIVLGALALGLGLGVAAAVARENLVGGFVLPAQVEAVTGLPVIAAIPLNDAQKPENMLLSDPLSPFAESLRRMRIGVEESVGNGGHNIVLVTSTEPGEGKSTMSICLGRALASAGHKTVLVDCDFRHPTVGKLAETESPIGLVDLIQRKAKPKAIFESLVVDAASPLHLMTSKASLTEASDLILNSVAFREFLEQLAQEYDYVVLDSPPIGYVVDARILAGVTDYLVYVIKQNSTSQHHAVGGLRQVIRTNNNGRVGLVLNSVTSTFGGYYGYKRYSYYYGNK